MGGTGLSGEESSAMARASPSLGEPVPPVFLFGSSFLFGFLLGLFKCCVLSEWYTSTQPTKMGGTGLSGEEGSATVRAPPSPDKPVPPIFFWLFGLSTVVVVDVVVLCSVVVVAGGDVVRIE